MQNISVRMASQKNITQYDNLKINLTQNQQNKMGLYLICLFLILTCSQCRWRQDEAALWYSSYSWSAGVNYIPAFAVNQIQMWESFNSTAIDEELGWAAAIGFSKLRVFLHIAPFQAHSQQFLSKVAQFVGIAAKHKHHIIFVLFDDCWKPQYHLGKQPAPIPGVHNSQWVQCPGSIQIPDAVLQEYVQKILNKFKADNTIILWDLYNEVGNGHGLTTLPLLKKAFQWARAVNPVQPLTSCYWGLGPQFKQVNDFVLSQSDVITFHAYCDPVCTLENIQQMKKYNRPVICTEYMARTRSSRFETHLPIFKQNQVWAINWGFVFGRTQTYYPWKSKEGDPVPKQWFHDVVYPDGTPFSPNQTKFIAQITKNSLLPPRPSTPFVKVFMVLTIIIVFITTMILTVILYRKHVQKKHLHFQNELQVQTKDDFEN